MASKSSAMTMRRAFVAVMTKAGPAALAFGVTSEASANPPPPKVLPDPPITAPTRDEAPTVIRRHETVCYAFYPSGGTLLVDCPHELQHEPLGEAMLKSPSGRCQFIPLQSGGPGRTGYIDTCPPAFAKIAKAGEVPEASKQHILWQEQQASLRRADQEPSWMDAPQLARLDTSTPQQVGCTGCTTTTRAHSAAPAGSAAALVLGAVALRRRSRR